MPATDSVRRNGYVIAIAIALVATFMLLAGSGWTASLLALGAIAIIGVVERIAEIQQRQSGSHDRRRD